MIAPSASAGAASVFTVMAVSRWFGNRYRDAGHVGPASPPESLTAIAGTRARTLVPVTADLTRGPASFVRSTRGVSASGPGSLTPLDLLLLENGLDVAVRGQQVVDVRLADVLQRDDLGRDRDELVLDRLLVYHLLHRIHAAVPHLERVLDDQRVKVPVQKEEELVGG